MRVCARPKWRLCRLCPDYEIGHTIGHTKVAQYQYPGIWVGLVLAMVRDQAMFCIILSRDCVGGLEWCV